MALDPTEAVVRAILMAMRLPPDDGSMGRALDGCVRSAVNAGIAAERAACEAVCLDIARHTVSGHVARLCADAIAARGNGAAKQGAP